MARSYNYKYTHFQLYRSMVSMLRSIPHLFANKIVKSVDSMFAERLMLAVTQVNGCEACSWAHARMALSGGFSQEEIEGFLSGSKDFIQPAEAVAILFGQQYAAERAKVTKASHIKLIETYGKAKSKKIVSIIQMMMFANLSGLPLSAIYRRFKKEKYENSSIFYELTMILAPILFLPFALLQAFIESILFISKVKYIKE